VNDARISMTRTLARSFDALHFLHTFFAESLQLSHSSEQLINLCESRHGGLIRFEIPDLVCLRSSSPCCDMRREIYYLARAPADSPASLYSPRRRKYPCQVASRFRRSKSAAKKAKRGKQRAVLQKWLTDLIQAMDGRILGFNVSTVHVWAVCEAAR
jgi:hypothetical protein